MNFKGKLAQLYPGMKDVEEDTEATKKIKESDSAPEQIQEKSEKNVSFWKRIAGVGLLITVFKCCIKGITDTIVISVRDMNPIVLLFFRSIIIFSLIIPMGLAKDHPPFPTGQSLQDRLLLVFRSIIGLLQVIANFYALQQMPLGVVKMIISTKPVFTIIFARVFLKEKSDFLDGVSILLLMGGVVTVIQPWDLQSADSDSGYSEQFLLATVLLFLSTGMASNIGIILRKLRLVVSALKSIYILISRGMSVLSLNSSRETIYIMMTFFAIFSFGFELFMPTWKVNLTVYIRNFKIRFRKG
jgi:drug/metabolite transporter (DMT)-like permease